LNPGLIARIFLFLPVMNASWQKRGGTVQFRFKPNVQPSPHASVIWAQTIQEVKP
jgi:hypothetical protein